MKSFFYRGHDKFSFNYQPAYADSSDLSDAIPTVSSYHNDALTLSLPVINQVQVMPHDNLDWYDFDFFAKHIFFTIILNLQMTWADVSWLALYCRKLKIVFMSVNVPTDFTDEIIFG